MPIALLFDVDGTLANTMGAGKAALTEAMAAVYGETGPVDGFDFHGRTDPEIVRQLLTAVGWSDVEIARGFPDLWPRYLERLGRELERLDGRASPLPGVPELLARVTSDDRFACGLVTGNLEDAARLKLAATGIGEAFTFGAYGSDAESRDELPDLALGRAAEFHGRRFDPARAVVIGDTPADIRCARAGGTRVLAVATGRHSMSELSSCAPDAVLPDLVDVGRALEFFLHG